MHTEDNTSETDMPTDQEFEYSPPIFTDPTHTAVMTHTDSEGEVKHGTNFLGRYCDTIYLDISLRNFIQT